MTILSTAFIFTFINIHSLEENNDISSNLYVVDYPNKYSRPICNIILWKALLHLLKKENFIIVDDIITMFNIIDEDKIRSTCKIISKDNQIYFSDFNNFLYNLKESDYNTIMSYISKDDLSTPTDWSIISTDNESTDNESTDNESIDNESIDNDAINLEEKNKIVNPLVKFYDPTMINAPKLTLRNKPQHYIEYKIEDKKPGLINIKEPSNQPPNEEKEYSWYMNYLIKLNEYFKCFWLYNTISSYIKVPIWVKKYF